MQGKLTGTVRATFPRPLGGRAKRLAEPGCREGGFNHGFHGGPRIKMQGKLTGTVRATFPRPLTGRAKRLAEPWATRGPDP